jgi:hypothetical protein
MSKDTFKWLLDKGLIFATILINTLSATISFVVIMVVLFVENWIRKNWP